MNLHSITHHGEENVKNFPFPLKCRKQRKERKNDDDDDGEEENSLDFIE